MYKNPSFFFFNWDNWRRLSDRDEGVNDVSRNDSLLFWELFETHRGQHAESCQG